MFSRHCQGAVEQNKMTALPKEGYSLLKKRLRGCLALALCSPPMRKKGNSEGQCLFAFWGEGAVY